MPGIRILSIVEQVAAHLREEILSGRWRGTVPGIHPLAAELGVNHKTVKSALHLLEKEGFLQGRGPGRRRTILVPGFPAGDRRMRIAILVGEANSKSTNYMIRLRHDLSEAGNDAFFTQGSLTELRFGLDRIGRLVEATEADAWVIQAGSREVLEWFCDQPMPAFALFGRRTGLPIASVGPDKPTATAQATRRLVELGHRRIVYLCHQERRFPDPGAGERAFLASLRAHGINPGPYNMPDWDETPDGLHRCLHSIFQVTPPTALFVDEPSFVIAALQFFGRRGIRVPDEVSLIATDPDPGFAWCHPPISHITWDSGPWIRRAVRWAKHVSQGKQDLRQSLTKSRFIEGGTIGPAAT